MWRGYKNGQGLGDVAKARKKGEVERGETRPRTFGGEFSGLKEFLLGMENRPAEKKIS